MFAKSWLRWARGEERYPGILDFAFSQLEKGYCWLNSKHLKKRREDPLVLPIPVLSVGNLTVGGTGKTGLVIALAKFLARKKRVVILHSGYRKKGKRFLVGERGFLLADPEEVGDEPVLIARSVPEAVVLADAKRKKLAEYAVRFCKPDLLLLDDGFQQKSFLNKRDILVIDALCPFGNGRLLPYGILREPISSLKEADCIVINRADAVSKERREKLKKRITPFAPVFTASYRIQELVSLEGEREFLSKVKGKRYGAFAGIGSPEGFLATLREEGFFPACFLVFPDHHLYREKDMERLELVRRKYHLEGFLTTEKDGVKLQKVPVPFKIWIVKVEMILNQSFFELVQTWL